MSGLGAPLLPDLLRVMVRLLRSGLEPGSVAGQHGDAGDDEQDGQQARSDDGHAVS
jgi:hypothetical protein